MIVHLTVREEEATALPSRKFYERIVNPHPILPNTRFEYAEGWAGSREIVESWIDTTGEFHIQVQSFWINPPQIERSIQLHTIIDGRTPEWTNWAGEANLDELLQNNGWELKS